MGYYYDVIVIGGGAAGLVAATGAAGLGAKTALIEKSKLGGDCTWYGCVPSKALLKSAQVFSLLNRMKEFGISGEANLNPEGVMAHVRQKVEQISTHHPAEVFEKRGITVLFGAPRFIGPRSIELAGKTLTAKRFIICTGSHPLVPQIEGLKEIDYLTNENIFELKVLPKSIAILGGGPIGVELSQALCRLGVEVSIIEMADRILAREDKEAADVLIEALLVDGVKIYTGKKAVKFFREGGLVAITVEDGQKKQSVIKAEKVLVAVGRSANVVGLDLEKAGVKYSAKGIQVDQALRSTAKNIYACGDVVGPYQFSHMAEYQAVIAVGNALFPFKRKVNYRAVPWCTFTDPELAHLGLTEEEAAKEYKNIKVYRSNYAQNDRAVTEQQEKGLVKVICDSKDHILGAHICGSSAGEIIHEYVLAMSAGLELGQISGAIHIYPTLSQLVKNTADQYYLNIFSNGRFKAIARFLLRFLR